MKFLKQFFTWWNGETLGTRLFTWRKGNYVGADAAGNKYYRCASAVPDSIPEHRWVVYNGYSEASDIPPGWHGWMHHKTDVLPSDQKVPHYAWEKPHQPNLTGTIAAYHPPGSLGQDRPQAPKPDYQPWQPE